MLCGSRMSLTCKTFLQYQTSRNMHISPISFLKQKYRQERGLPLNPNASGVLTDSPDYSYLDGRITPLTQGQRRRVIRNEQLKQQVIALSKEIDFAVERYSQLQMEEKDKKQKILDRKLKPKGAALLEAKKEK